MEQSFFLSNTHALPVPLSDLRFLILLPIVLLVTLSMCELVELNAKIK